MIIYIKEFFDTLLGADLPLWFYNSFGIVIVMSITLSFLKILFPKLSKYVGISILAITLGYVVYNVIPMWGIGITGGMYAF